MSAERDWYYEEGDDEQEDREDDRPTCGCRYCFCSQRTDYGEQCSDCAAHAHQG